MTGKPADRLAEEVLAHAERAGTLRALRTVEGAVGPRMRLGGREVCMLSSGNYLDLAHDPRLAEAAGRAARDVGCAASGSRLINGNHACHEALEAELAHFFGSEAALVFSTGYMANLGVIQALVGEGDVVLSDALVHASIVDGVRLSRASVRVFAHGDVAALRDEVVAVRASARRVLVVVDGVYSMDGDLAPLPGIAEVAREYGAMLLVDDSHGTGALGLGGRGSVEQLGVLDAPDVIVGTLGKALGSFGAFAVCSRGVRELLLNTARSFVFSCALAPPQVEAAREALRIVRSEPWRRQRLQANAERLRARLDARGISTAPSVTHIVPIVIGDNARTMAVCEGLLERGFHAQGIRHPSVPHGTARLRVTPMATHQPSELDGFADALASLL